MTNEETKLAMPSAKKVIEVLRKLRISNEKCPECKGYGDLRLSNIIDSTGHFEICPKCNGTGKISQKEMQKQAQESIAKKEQGRYRLVYKKDKRTIVAEPRRYEWKPEWLDPLMFQNRLYWFKSSDESDRFKGWIFILSEGVEEAALHVPQKYCIPILDWQEIERILFRYGWHPHFENLRDNKYHFEIFNLDVSKKEPDGHENCLVIRGSGDNRQQAVTKALLELDKELK